MGINPAGWQEKLISKLKERGIIASLFYSGDFLLLQFPENEQLIIHLLPVHHHFKPEVLLELQQTYRLREVQLIQLWEDIGLTREEQILSRLTGLLGRNKKIHGRKTKIIAISQAQADQFLNLYHLQGSAKARDKYALTLDNEMIAVATFSAKRKMTREKEGYTSVELIRFATKDGITVQGGLSKLIKHLIRESGPNDVMTYADLDWSYGKGYAKLGFTLTEQTAPAEICLDTQQLIRYFPHRLPADIPPDRLVRIFNMGNLKYILYL